MLPLIQDPNGLRRFSDSRIQQAVESALTEMDDDDPVSVVAHHVYNNDGTRVENVTKLSIVVRPLKDSKLKDFTVMVGGFKDWSGGDLGAEAKVVWKPSWL